jgi:hypothetical protein
MVSLDAAIARGSAELRRINIAAVEIENTLMRRPRVGFTMGSASDPIGMPRKSDVKFFSVTFRDFSPKKWLNFYIILRLITLG